MPPTGDVKDAVDALDPIKEVDNVRQGDQTTPDLPVGAADAIQHFG